MKLAFHQTKQNSLVLICLALFIAPHLMVRWAGVAAPRTVSAAGPLAVDEASGTPLAWNPDQIFYNLDSGPLGRLSESEARELVRIAFANWSAVPGAKITVQEKSPLQDKNGVPIDVTLENVDQVLSDEPAPGSAYPLPDGQSPVIFDNEGRILDSLFGPRSGVIGLAGFEVVDNQSPHRVVEGVAFFNSTYVDDNPDNSFYDFTNEEFQGVVTHEIGHFLGLGHCQVNGPSIIFDRELFGFGKAPVESIETMNPFSIPKTGVAAGNPGRDDQVALAQLYPDPAQPVATIISGRVFQPDGATPLQGANIIARNVNDPFFDAVSQLSGARYVPPFFNSGLTSNPPGPANLENLYELPGLSPDQEYVILMEPTAGGSFSSLTTFEVTSEFYNTGESGNPEIDQPLLQTSIRPQAGRLTEGINFIVNAGSARELLSFPRITVSPESGAAAIATIGIPGPAPVPGVSVALRSRNKQVFADQDVLIPAGKTSVEVRFPRFGPGVAGFEVTAQGYLPTTLVIGAASAQPELNPLPPNLPASRKLAVGEIKLSEEEPPFQYQVRLLEPGQAAASERKGSLLARLPEIRGPNQSQGRITQMAFSLDGQTLYVAHGFAGTSVFLVQGENTPAVASTLNPERPWASPEARRQTQPIQVRSAIVWRVTDSNGDGVAEAVDYFETGTADIQDLVVTSTATGESLILASNFSDARSFFNRPPGTVAPLKAAILAYEDSDADGKIDGNVTRQLITTDDLALRDVTEVSGGMAIDQRDRLFFTARNTLKNITSIQLATDTDADGYPDKLQLLPFVVTPTTTGLSGLARLRIRESDDRLFFSSVTVQDTRFIPLAGALFTIPDLDGNNQGDGLIRVAQDLSLNSVSPNITNSGLEFGPDGEVYVIGAFPGFQAGPLVLPQYTLYQLQPASDGLAMPQVFDLGVPVDLTNKRVGFLTGLARGTSPTRFQPRFSSFSLSKKVLSLNGFRFRKGLTLTVNGTPVAPSAYTVTPTQIVLSKGKKLLPRRKSAVIRLVNPDGQSTEITVSRL